MKIYTGSGDNGKSGTISDEDVSKDADIFHVLGTIDELSANIGVAKCEADKEIFEVLEKIQTQLISIAAYISGGNKVDFVSLTKEYEKAIDDFSKKVSLPDKIILSGNTLIGARVDVARTVARRLERCVVASGLIDESLMYFNRLSDLLYVLARYADVQ